MANRIFLTTPAFNAADTIDQTILSVVSQRADVDVTYHVQDGGSTDGTVEILEQWRRRLEGGGVPIQVRSLHFSFNSRPDDGMYDAIGRGFEGLAFGGNDWLGWINADDLLTPAAFPLLQRLQPAAGDRGRVDWVTGTSLNLRDGLVAGKSDHPVCREVVRLGLCDGVHWPFVQQEGTFFRGHAWQAVGPTAFRGLKLAGDYNLWRLLAERYEIFQYGHPTGAFCIREGQKSETDRAGYESEIELLVSLGRRREGFLSLETGQHNVFRIATEPAVDGLRLHQQSIDQHLRYRRDLLARTGANTLRRESRRQSSAVRSSATPTPALDGDIERSVSRTGCIIGYDRDWQYPAITEQHAFRQAQSALVGYDKAVLLAFPWATLIDLLNAKKQREAERLLCALEACSKLVHRGEYVVTVCQHIEMLRYEHVLVNAGVRHVFWAHARAGQHQFPNHPHVRIAPFPLYPVQAVGHEFGDEAERPYLFSFVGARCNSWYLTCARDWILEELAGHERGFVRGRESWHYDKIVYGKQIGSLRIDDGKVINDEASNQFRELLKRSVFSLCPSGSGPNTIRLWESLGLGAIPVVISDLYEAPGNPELWREAVVLCPETEEAVRRLPGVLEDMAADSALLERKRHAMRQVWSLYGPDCFIYDLQRLFLEVQAGTRVFAASSSQHADQRLLKMAHDLLAIRGAEDARLLKSFALGCSSRLLMDEQRFEQMLRESEELCSAVHRLLRSHGGLIPATMRDRLRSCIDT